MPFIQSSEHDKIVPCWIDSSATTTNSSLIFPVISASQDKTVHHAQGADVSTARTAADSCWRAFQSWKKTSHVVRRDLLLKVADIYEKRVAEFVEYQMTETSCDEAWAKNNHARTVVILREIASAISSVKGEIPQIEDSDVTAFVFREPVGPILCIPPWNAALILSTRAIAGAIGAGCTVLLKASELCPRTHHAIVEAFEEAGCPKGVLNQIQCRREDAGAVTEEVIKHEGIRKVEFIGSAAVGKIIGQVAAKYLKPTMMELGGKCPAIVLEDADIELAVKSIGMSAFLHHGQICFSTERIILLSPIADKFKTALLSFIKTWSSSSHGGAVTKQSAQHAHDVLTDAQSHGASFLTPGGPEFTSANTLAPAIVLSPPAAARIADEETFGPSASLYVVSSEDEAVTLANRSAYGLNATIWTRDMGKAVKLGRRMEYGQVHTNSPSVYTAATAPQGGNKGSGWGRQNAGYGLEEYYQMKTITFREVEGKA